MNFLKSAKGVLITSLIVSWVVVGVGGYFYYDSNQKTLLSKDEKIVQLETDLTNIGELVPAYSVASDVKMGKQIQETDLVEVSIPIGAAGNMISDMTQLVGKYYRLDLTAGTVISTDAIYEDPITDDLRLFDLVVNNVPVGLKEGSYVDVRISLPMGEDFIALSHKKVKSINAGVLKLSVTSKDIHTYNSMLLDSLIYPGTSIYAIEYIEGGVQKAADTYYPVSSNILAIAQKDPNLLEAIKSDMLQKREVLDKDLGKFTDKTITDEAELERVLALGRSKYSSLISEAERQYIITAAQKAADEALQNP